MPSFSGACKALRIRLWRALYQFQGSEAQGLGLVRAQHNIIVMIVSVKMISVCYVRLVAVCTMWVCVMVYVLVLAVRARTEFRVK